TRRGGADSGNRCRPERRAAHGSGASRRRSRRQPCRRGNDRHDCAAASDGGRRWRRARRPVSACRHAGEVVTIGPRVLLVEDEAGLRLTLSDRLASEGYQVDTAADGETGLASASQGVYDLIVLDVMLPRMNGFDVCREARRRGIATPIL